MHKGFSSLLVRFCASFAISQGLGNDMAIPDTLKRLSPSLNRVRVLVIIIAVIALPFTVYYLVYVRSQSRYFTDRSFRKLSLISRQISLKVESAGSVLKNTSEKFIRPPAGEADLFDQTPEGKQQNLGRLNESFKRLKDTQIIPVKIDVEPWQDKLSPGTVTLNAVRHEGDSSWLYLDYLSEGKKDKTVIRVQAKTDLNRLVQPFLSTRVGSDPGQFKNILISEADTARVIFQYDTSQVRLASLDRLSSSNDEGKKIDLKEIAQNSNVIDVGLTGANYRLFSHPLRLCLPSSNANAPNASWITSGLIESNYFQTEAWSISIPYTILIIGGFAVILLVFSWPFLKLILAGPKDRFRPKDVYFLIFATIVVLAVLTCFGLYGYVYTRAEAQVDDQVESLATDIKSNFNNELTQALTQLDALSKNDKILTQLESQKDKPKKSAEAEEDKGLVIYQQKQTNKTDILPALIKAGDKTPYPYFDTVTWIDSTGMQRAKWTVKRYTTQYIPVTGRAYFENVRKGLFYELGDHKFWLEPVISRTTGRNAVEISKPAINPKWTVAFDTRLLSLMDPVLPAGYGYAIIANDGKVLFHSDEARHLGENLFQECDEDRNLRSAVMGRGDKVLSVRYLGEDHRFFITTLKGFPDWSLAVFTNKQPLRSVFFELLTSVSGLFMIYGLILMAGFTVFYLINVVNENRAWLWPSEKKTAIYLQSVFFLFGLSVISLALIIVLHGQLLVWVIAAIGFFSGFAYFVNLRWGYKLVEYALTLLNRFKRPRSRFFKYASTLLNQFKRHDRAYVLNVSLLLLLTSILPAGAFFKYAYESEIKLFIKHAQFSLATKLAKRDERIRSQYFNINFTDSAPSEKFINHRLGKSWDVYDNFFFQTARASSAGAQSCIGVAKSDLLSTWITLFPLSNRTSMERRELLDNTSVEGVGKWEHAANGNLVFHRDGNAGGPASHMNTSVPILGVPGFAGLGIIVLFFPLFVFINSIVRRVFSLDANKPIGHSLRSLLSEKIDRNVFVVVNAPGRKAAAKGNNLYLRDLRSLATSPDWVDKFDYASCSDETVIALDQFDYRMDDPQLNLQKLKFVENLLEKQKTLMIFSSAESCQYQFATGANGHTNGDRDGARRWAGIMISNFFTEYAEDIDDTYAEETDDDASFRKQVNQQKARIPARGLHGRSKKEIEALFNTLFVECAPREPLQRCGRQILAQKDFVTLSRAQLIRRIVNQARTYYTHIWDSCSMGEKLTLSHLAQDRLLSHRDPDLEPLLRRELIVRDQDLHLFNESFRQFVKAGEQVACVAKHDAQERQGSWWQSFKVPILVVMVAITAFLFITQQDVYSSSLALMTGVTTLIPALFKVLSMFQSDPLSRPPN
jgi:Cache domain